MIPEDKERYKSIDYGKVNQSKRYKQRNILEASLRNSYDFESQDSSLPSLRNPNLISFKNRKMARFNSK
jgi:hypothetical protein